ncbi:MAG: repair exonuclease [Burkholderia sp.]|jgi:3',5'-cyclic AMP phosphodiesterase CpdA|nr:repair exonuclease [Burkholderia sp.]
MSVVMQISDTHFGTEQAEVVEALLRMFREEKPELVILSGDITQRARRSQFAAARAFVDQLAPTPLVAIPGNHDIPLLNMGMRLIAPYANYSRVFGAELEPEFSAPKLLVMGVNTTRPYKHADGEVSVAQVQRVATRLMQATPDQLRIVVTHQPICALVPEDEANVLQGHAGAVRRWAEAGADLVLGGHIHLPYVIPLKERHPYLSRRMWAVQAGTAISSRLRHGANNSVNLIRYSDGQRPAWTCSIERWDFQPQTRHFMPVNITALELDRRAAAAR